MRRHVVEKDVYAILTAVDEDFDRGKELFWESAGYMNDRQKADAEAMFTASRNICIQKILEAVRSGKSPEDCVNVMYTVYTDTTMMFDRNTGGKSIPIFPKLNGFSVSPEWVSTREEMFEKMFKEMEVI